MSLSSASELGSPLGQFSSPKPDSTRATVASNASAHLTNFADARACKPLRLQIVTSALGFLLSNTTQAFANAPKVPTAQASPERTWLATLMYFLPASLAAFTAAARVPSPRTLASLISIGKL